nr:RHS repeat-associated core domain-containing protein [Geobacillus sp. YHL]
MEDTYRFDYDERGNIRTFTTGNGAGSTFTYDDRGLVESVSVGTADGKEIVSETYRYDENGNRTEIATPTGAKTLYRYDALDQLVEEQWPDGTTIAYTYDGFGNRKQIVKTKDGQSTTTTADYNAANQLIRFGDETIMYDANGNRVEDGQCRYEWNEADQLVSITRKGESTPFVTYQYDEDGRRIQKTVNGVVTNYHYQGDSLNVLYETDASGNVVRSYIYGENGQLLAMKKGNATYFYHYNAHGDVIALTDAQGNIVARYQYDAWGNILSQSGSLAEENPYRYAGYQYDQETGLYYLIARYYHPTHGVFLSLDPDPGDADDLLTQNGYVYANNNPVMFVDPDGKYRVVVSLLVKLVNRLKTLFKGKCKSCKYKNVTKSGSRYINIQTDVSKAEFEKNLLRNGWRKSKSKDGKTTIFTKDGAKYVLRDEAKSTDGPTADYYPKGSKKMTLKIRFKTIGDLREFRNIVCERKKRILSVIPHGERCVFLRKSIAQTGIS